MNKLQDQLLKQRKTKALLKQAQQAAFDYIDNQSKQRVFPNAINLEKLTVFDEPLPEVTSDSALLIELLDTVGSINYSTCLNTLWQDLLAAHQSLPYQGSLQQDFVSYKD
jgi:hypothetical protein